MSNVTKTQALLNSYETAINARLAIDCNLFQNNRYYDLEAIGLIALLNTVDPSRTKSYVNWLLRVWLSGSFRFFEDISKAYEPLCFYDKIKPKLDEEFRDIGRFKTFTEFDDFIDGVKYIDPRSNNEVERQFEADLISKGEAEIYFNSDDIKVIIPKTEAAAVYFGRNTKWCTSAIHDNQFDWYNEKGDLYIVLFKKTGIRWQYHFQMNQFMNSRDEALTPEEMKSISYLWSERMHIAFVVWNSNDLSPYGLNCIERPSQEVIYRALTTAGSAIRFINDPSEKYKFLAVRTHGSAIRFIEKQGKDLQLLAIKDNPLNILWIKNPTLEFIFEAIEIDPSVICYLHKTNIKVTTEIYEHALKSFGNDPMKDHFLVTQCKPEN